MSFRSVIVGVDGSDVSWRALAMAVQLAKRDDGDVHACFVRRSHGSILLTAEVREAPFAATDDESTDQLGQEVAKRLLEGSATGDFSVREGETAAELEALAQVYLGEVIVIGRSQHPTLHLGGVVRQLLTVAPRPVLVVP